MIAHLAFALAFAIVYIAGFLWWVRCMILTEYRQFYRGLILCIVLIVGICYCVSIWGLQ